MAGLKILYNLILKDTVKGSGSASGILSIGKDVRKLADKKFQRYITTAKNQNVNLDKLSEQEIKYMMELNKPKEPRVFSNEEAYKFLNQFLKQGKGKSEVIKFPKDKIKDIDKAKSRPPETEIIGGIQTTKGLGDLFPKQLEKKVTVRTVIEDIKKLEPMDSMKETNKVLRGEGKYKNLSKADREKIASDESVTDHIFERNIEPDPEDFAYGGVAGMLGERTGFKRGTKPKKKKKKKKSRKKFNFGPISIPPEMAFREPVNFPYKSLEDIPPNVLAMLKKDPNFDLETFLTKVGWSDADKTRIQEKLRGTVSSGVRKGEKDEAWGMYTPRADMSFLNYQKFGESEPLLERFDIKSPSDADKVQTILHEMRHQKMRQPWFMKSSAVPEYVRETKDPNYSYQKYGDDDPNKFVGGEELFVRFMDQHFGDVAEKGTIAGSDYKPYFDKILKDHWDPYAKRYEDILKEEKRVKSKPYGLAGGGVAGMLGEPTYQDEEHRVPYGGGGTGKPPITFNLTGGGSYGRDENIQDMGQTIPGLNQQQYNYNLNLGAEMKLPWNLTATGNVGIGRGSTKTDYKGQPVDWLSGVGETKLGDQWNVGLKWSKKFNEGGRVPYSKGSSSEVLPADFDELDPDELMHIIKLLKAGEIPEYASGGRIGFKNGKGPKMSRRTFLKGLGALAALPVFGKFFKFAKPAAKVADLTSVPIKNAEGMPVWFKPLVNRVIKEGDDVTKQFAWKERQIIHSKKLGEEQGVKVYQDLDNQTISVEYQSADNMGGIDDSVNLEYKAAEEIPIDNEVFKNLPKGKSSVKTKPTFKANEAYPYQDPRDYKDVTFQDINAVNKVDDLISDTSALKQFGTNKTLSKKELEIAKQKRKRVKKINEDPWEELAGKEYVPDYDPYASGGRVPRSGGGIMKLLKTILKKTPKKSYERVDLEKLLKEKDKIKVYSGSMKRQSNTWKSFVEDAKQLGTTPEKIAKDKFKGQWFTPFRSYAESFSNPSDLTAKMRTVELTPKEIKLAKRYVEKLNKKDMLASMRRKHGIKPYPKHMITTDENLVLIPRYKLKKLKKENKIMTDYLIKDKIKSKLGLAEGGVAGMLGE